MSYNPVAGGGGVTDVSATSPITSSGGATPDISTSIATDKLLGRDSAGTGVAEQIGLGASLEFSGAGTIQRAALTGDVTAAANGNATTIAAGVVTLAKMADLAADRLLGRGNGGGTGAPQAIALGTNLSMSGTTLNASGGSNVGTAVIDFGSYPGKTDASVAVTGQTSIIAGSVVSAWIRPVATSDHSADEHLVEAIRVLAGNISAGVGFTIYAFADGASGTNTKWKAAIPGNSPANAGGEGQRVYGQFTVAWQWS